MISSLFGDNVPEGVAWDRIPPELMTPRERLLRRSSLIMFGARSSTLSRQFIVIGIAIHAANQDSALFAALQEAALSRFTIDADTAALLIFAGISGERGDSAGAGGGDHGAGTVDRLHRLAADGGNLAALLAFGFTPAFWR